MHTSIHAYIHIHVYIYTCTQTNTHTNIHTYIAPPAPHFVSLPVVPRLLAADAPM